MPLTDPAVRNAKSGSKPFKLTDLRGALPPVRVRHHPSVTDPARIATLLRDIDGYSGSFVTLCALQLAPLVFVRPGELRHAEWSEFNLDTALEDHIFVAQPECHFVVEVYYS
ncbi:hypothetical protein [Nitrosospira sp. NpAV]|uniref:tyrosine-type recombinase/integrase n=1 Tax=Nitrosospira sp. NpAV TaxID=58133 RepID=UPI0005A1DEA5|nr:hypothetical protein [Nitrosospira sp. NpAV]KIO49123.1 hypothetical protein SQ11_07425 [Nitrosospira sp. NpAV]